MSPAQPAREEEPTGAAEQGITIDKRKALIAVVLAIILAGGAITALGQVAQLHRIEHALSHAAKLWLVPCVAGQLLAYLGYILAYRDAARADGGPCFSFPVTARIVVFGAGLSVLGASVGGLAVDWWALRRTGTPAHVATRRVLGVGTIEWVVMSIYACVSAALVLLLGGHAPLGMAIGWLLAVPAAVAGALWFTSPRRVERYVNPRRREHRPEHGRLTKLAVSVENKLRSGIDDAIAGVIFVRHLLSHPRRYMGGTIGYPIYWAGDMLTLYAAVRAFGGHPSLDAMILAYCTSFVISALPLPAGGAGGIEAAVSLALHSIGVPLASAVIAVLLYRIITFWLPIVPSLALLPSIRRLHEELPEVPHSKRDPDERISFRPEQSPEPDDESHAAESPPVAQDTCANTRRAATGGG